MEKLTIKDLVEKALADMMPKVGEIACTNNSEIASHEVFLATANDTAKILYFLKNAKLNECSVLCGKERNNEEEEDHFCLHVITDTLDKLFWRELYFHNGVKNHDLFDGIGIRRDWQVVGFMRDQSIAPTAEQITGKYFFQLLMEKVAQKMQKSMPEKSPVGDEAKDGQEDLGELTTYEKALALINLEVIEEHGMLIEQENPDAEKVFELATLAEISQVLFHAEVKLRIGFKTKKFCEMTFLDNWHVVGTGLAVSETDFIANAIKSPFGMAVLFASMLGEMNDDDDE